MSTQQTENPMKRLVSPRSLAALAALALAACSSNGKAPAPPAPKLQSFTVSSRPLYLAVGATQQLVATGKFDDGSTAAVTSGLAWTSSDAGVATVDANGVVTGVGAGDATITATHAASGASAAAQLTARRVTSFALTGAEARSAGHVDTSKAYYRVSGLTPGAFYTVDMDELDDDVDIATFSDLSLSEDAQLCASETVGTARELCVIPASATGDVYVAVNGEWTESGSRFTLHATPAVPVSATSIALAQLPITGSSPARETFYRVTGLKPGGAYGVKLSQLTDDADLEVYADPYEYTEACASFLSGTADEACTATANAAGELLVEVDAADTANGSDFKLEVTAAP